jgi:hypothetical protein
MRHFASRQLFAHWNEQRGVRAVPERGDIEPGAMRNCAGDIFIVGFDAGEVPRFRLAGTRVCALFGRELKDETSQRCGMLAIRPRCAVCSPP